MEIALLVAKIYGIVLLALGLGMLVNSSYYKKVLLDLLNNTAVIFIGGLAALAIGIVIVMNHNIWEAGWVLIVTLIGWLAIIKGALLLILPKSAGLFESWFQNKNFIIFAGVFALIVGAVLTYYGFLV
jgi:hypothetical protein